MWGYFLGGNKSFVAVEFLQRGGVEVGGVVLSSLHCPSPPYPCLCPALQCHFQYQYLPVLVTAAPGWHHGSLLQQLQLLFATLLIQKANLHSLLRCPSLLPPAIKTPMLLLLWLVCLLRSFGIDSVTQVIISLLCFCRKTWWVDSRGEARIHGCRPSTNNFTTVQSMWKFSEA